MPIVTKNGLISYTEALESRHNALIEKLRGSEPNPNVYNLYHDDPAQYSNEFREVNELEIKLAIHDFEGILKELKNLKSIQAVKLHSAK